jgi:hypothetical protein
MISRKASAITISIFIMMILLAVLLGYTAFYIDQVTIRPVVMMIDSEISLKCFFVLSSIMGGEYVRDGEPVPEDSMRHELLKTYGLQNAQEAAVLKKYADVYNESLNLMYGGAELIVRNEEVFWQTVFFHNLPVECFTTVYGPIRTGTAGLFTRSAVERAAFFGQTIPELMNGWQERLFPLTT